MHAFYVDPELFLGAYPNEALSVTAVLYFDVCFLSTTHVFSLR